MRKDEREQFISKLKRKKRKMVSDDASSSEIRKIRKAIKRLQEEA